MKFISGIKEISDLYTHFIFDIWGVIHDGFHPYPEAIETISFLHKEGKQLCFLSNAPRRAHKVEAVLQKFGITPNLYDFALSSGEATFHDLKENQENGFKKFGQNYVYIGPQKDIDLLDGLAYKKVDNTAEADFAITTGFDHDNSTLEEKLPQAIEARKHNLPMICVNPDMIVVRQNGHEMICAGALAREYEKMGGKVIYYGKPFSAVYKMACENFNQPENKKTLAIGDGLETDIKGANDFGIDSVLVTGGILARPLGIKSQQTADRAKLEEVCNSYQVCPQFVISHLKV